MSKCATIMNNRLEIYENAYEALALLVKDEYPKDFTLVEIAEIWGKTMSGAITPEQIEAIKRIEGEP
jgi:hypothetical protein